jgi:hypothetical protein
MSRFTLVCPVCSRWGNVTDPTRFEVRGKWEGLPVFKCLGCGSGIQARPLGKPRALAPDLWSRMEVSWRTQFGDERSTAISPVTSQPPARQVTAPTMPVRQLRPLPPPMVPNNPLGLNARAYDALRAVSLDVHQLIALKPGSPVLARMPFEMLVNFSTTNAACALEGIPENLAFEVCAAYTVGILAAEVALNRELNWGVPVDNLPEATKAEARREAQRISAQLLGLDAWKAFNWVPESLRQWLAIVGHSNGTEGRIPEALRDRWDQAHIRVWAAGLARGAQQLSD